MQAREVTAEQKCLYVRHAGASDCRVKADSLASQKEKLTFIAGLDTKVSIPAILQIILALEKSGDPSGFLFFSLQFFIRHDRLQRVSFLERHANSTDLTKDVIQSAHLEWMRRAKEIEVTREKLPQWHELAVWLQGYYQKVYADMPKDKKGLPQRELDGGYVAADIDELAFKKKTGFTKLDVADLYRRLAMMIVDKVNQFQSLPSHEGTRLNTMLF